MTTPSLTIALDAIAKIHSNIQAIRIPGTQSPIKFKIDGEWISAFGQPTTYLDLTLPQDDEAQGVVYAGMDELINQSILVGSVMTVASYLFEQDDCEVDSIVVRREKAWALL